MSIHVLPTAIAHANSSVQHASCCCESDLFLLMVATRKTPFSLVVVVVVASPSCLGHPQHGHESWSNHQWQLLGVGSGTGTSRCSYKRKFKCHNCNTITEWRQVEGVVDSHPHHSTRHRPTCMAAGATKICSCTLSVGREPSSLSLRCQLGCELESQVRICDHSL